MASRCVFSAYPVTANRTTAVRSKLPLAASHIFSALEKAGAHRGNATIILGISERNLYRKLREYGLLG